MKRSISQFVLRISPEFKARIGETASLRHRTVNSSANFAVDAWLAAAENPSDSRILDAMTYLAGDESLGLRLDGDRRARAKSRAKDYGITMNCAFLLAFEDWISGSEAHTERAGERQEGQGPGANSISLRLPQNLQQEIARSRPGAPLEDIIQTTLEGVFLEHRLEQELTALLQAAGWLQPVLPDKSRDALTHACISALAAFRAGDPQPTKDLFTRIRSVLRVFDDSLPPRLGANDLRHRCQRLWRSNHAPEEGNPPGS